MILFFEYHTKTVKFNAFKWVLMLGLRLFYCQI